MTMVLGLVLYTDRSPYGVTTNKEYSRNILIILIPDWGPPLIQHSHPSSGSGRGARCFFVLVCFGLCFLDFRDILVSC